MDNLRRRTSLAALAALALTTVLVPLTATRSDAAPEDDPGTPVVLSSAGTSPYVSRVLRAPDGTLYVGIGSVASGKGSARFTRRAPGGDWEAPVLLSTPTTSASAPELALLPDGGVAALWSEWDGVTSTVRYAERPAGHVWSAPVTLTTDGRDARFAVGAGGDVVAAWRLWATPRIYAAERPAGGEWSAPALVSGLSVGADEPEVAVAPDGDAVVVFRTTAWVGWVRSASMPAGGAWAAPVDVAPATGVGSSDPLVVMDDEGRATALWEQDYGTEDGMDYYGQVATASLAPGAAVWGPAIEISGPEADTRYLSAGVDDAGTVTAAWTEPVGSGMAVRTARQVDGTWAEPVTVSAPDATSVRPDSARVDVRADGRAAATWLEEATEGDESVHLAKVATATADGTWGAPRSFASGGGLGGSTVVLTDDADVDAVWTTGTVQAAFLDLTAPVVDVISLPTGATSGTPLDVAVAASDRWSDVEAAWDFGDGGTGAGLSAQHTYEYGGEYVVTVTVRDSSGNTATGAATLDVTGPPRPTPTPAPTATPTATPTTPAPSPAPAAAAPRVTSLHLTSVRIRAVGGRGKAPKLTRVQLRVSDATSATVTVVGQRRGLPRVTLRPTVTSGAAIVTLRAKVGRRTLPPGRYVVTVVADGAGGTSAPVRATLRVVG